MNTEASEDTSEHLRVLWPDVPRMVFGPGEPHVLNACTGWVMSRPDRLQAYASGYHEAARRLYETAAQRLVNADLLVFPIAFLWRHHIELMLKDIISRGRELAGQQAGHPAHHRLLDLWKDALTVIQRIGDPAAPELANVEANIRELECVDEGSFAFRYPTSKAGTDALPEEIEYVNLRVLHEALTAVSNLLSAAVSVLILQKEASQPER